MVNNNAMQYTQDWGWGGRWWEKREITQVILNVSGKFPRGSMNTHKHHITNS